MGRLDGQSVLVIGGSSGMGRAIASAAAAEGARVTIASRNADKLEAAAAAIGHGTRTRQLDVTDESAVEHVVDEARQLFGRIDGLVSVAGGSGPASSTSASGVPSTHSLMT